MTTDEFARRVDHTALRPDATRQDVETLCREARDFRFAAACVAPVWVSLASKLLRETSSRVCTVIGFPHGTTLPAAKACEAREALEAGADELDMVVAVGLLASGDVDAVRRDIAGVVEAARRRPGAIVKVILETSLLSDAQKILGCRLAEEAGADFVKTSTGFGPGGATAEDVALLAKSVGGRLGVKAAGGIGSLDFALQLLDAGATRLGCSASVDLARDLARRSRSSES
ncbi:MAG: deoxyribose-phosphate aldolase [Thermoanaerobaculia bacterium]